MDRSVVLLVMSRECSPPLLKALKSLAIDVLAVENCQEMRGLLQTHPAVQLIITQVTLADGNWCDLFKYLVDRHSPVSMVVSSPQAYERLWCEVLWRGAYDLLVEPYKSGEVCRVVEGALRAAHASGQARAVGI